MFCQKCGNKVNEGDRFCASCGAPVKLPINNEVKKIQLDGVEMSAEDMIQYCMDNDYIAKKLNKTDVLVYTNMFETLINEVQSDEIPKLCFVGPYDFKNAIYQAGARAYLLTNKRLISVGLCSSSLAGCNPLITYKFYYQCHISKKPKFKVYAIYLRDMISATENVVSSRDVITFNTTKKSINVLIYKPNATHRLCDQINAVIKEYREQNPQ